jgi:starch-binding outer membrane protein, SusD/RagB family
MKKMKTNLKIMMLILMITSLNTSCSDDKLVEKPTTFATPNQLVTNKAGAEIYLAGAYDALQNLLGAGGDYKNRQPFAIHWGTTATDEVVTPGWEGARKIIFLQQVTPTESSVREMWKQLYQAVNQINSVIDRVSVLSENQISTADKENIIAQAKFLRAAAYFSLVSAWENVPLVEHETISLSQSSIEVPQSTADQTYQFIIKDLKYAISILPSKQGGGRATKGSSQALLAKVYLQMTGFPLKQTDKFAPAEALLSEVMSSGVYGLLPNYAQVFDLNHEQSVEMVFALGMQGPGISEGGNLGTFYGPNGSVRNGGGWGTCYINQEFESSYDRNDLRLRNNVAVHNADVTSPEAAVAVDPSTWSGDKTPWRGWKWHASKPNNYANDTPFDNPYIRYADVLLMYAEARNGQGKLTQSDIDLTVNKLRERARYIPTAVPNMVLGGKQQNADEILKERRQELCFEGWRRNDLIRFGKYKQTILAINQSGWSTAGNPGPNYQDFKIRWPIPDAEIKLNTKLKQNEGYN